MCINMNTKTTTGIIMKVYVVLAFAIVLKYFYVVTNGLDNKLVAGGNQPTAVAINYNINSLITIAVIFGFFYYMKSVKYSTRSIR